MTMPTMPDDWTWWDDDPAVAWDVPESYHGKARAALEAAGWEPCYHRNGVIRLHYDLKQRGMEWRRALWETIDREAPNRDRTRMEQIVESLRVGDGEVWWGDAPWALEEEARETFGYYHPDAPLRVFLCGRSGGYLQLPDWERAGIRLDAMLKVAPWLAGQRAYYNSAEYGQDLAERALEEYAEQGLARLASPRPERVEA